MQLKQINIGNYTTENNVFIAPLAGYTDYCFRNGEIDLGAGLTFTELTSAKGIVYGSKGNFALLTCGKGDYINKTACQIFGSDPYYMRLACENEQLKDYKIVDINMGCPVPKVFKNGEGSALLKDILTAENVIKECVKSGKIITVKIRTGLKVGDNIATEYAKMAENAGAKLITIHGRVRDNYYSGEIDFNAIENAKKSVSIPVIANGGIFTEQDANIVMERTGADGIMLARGALSNPFLICELLHKNPNINIKDFIINQLKLMSESYGDRYGAVLFRKFIPYYFKGRYDFKEIKLQMQQQESIVELIKLIEQFA